MNATPSLKLIFAGTPAFSAVALEALLASTHEVVAVYTQPDRPAGRGRQLTASPVKALALAHDLPIVQPLTLRDAAAQAELAGWQADVMVVVAYGLILPPAVLSAPRLGCINIHASLLPHWRGAAPIQRSLLAGDTETGITIMQMDAGLDTGAMLDKVACPISLQDTSETLHDRLAHLGATRVLKTLNDLATGTTQPVSQDSTQATYAHKLTKEEARIDWQQPAAVIDRQVRAFLPWPVAHFPLGNDMVRIFKAEALATTSDKAPGTIVATSATGIDVATGAGLVRLQSLQFPGGRPLSVKDILHARADWFAVGNMLGAS